MELIVLLACFLIMIMMIVAKALLCTACMHTWSREVCIDVHDGCWTAINFPIYLLIYLYKLALGLGPGPLQSVRFELVPARVSWS